MRSGGLRPLSTQLRALARTRCRRLQPRQPLRRCAKQVSIDAARVVGIHNPFAVNDVWFMRQTGLAQDAGLQETPTDPTPASVQRCVRMTDPATRLRSPSPPDGIGPCNG